MMFSKLFHEEVFMPSTATTQTILLQKGITNVELSKHFEEQHVDTSDYKHCLQKSKILSAIMSLTKKQVSPFEVELSKDFNIFGPGWHVTKYVVRMPYDVTRDVTFVIAVGPKNKTLAFIKTAWLNDKSDVHTTLDSSKYDTTL